MVLAVVFVVLPAAAAARIASSAAARISPSTQDLRAAPPHEDRIDINHATVAQLLKIPSMTPSWAGRIVRFRPYRTKRNLLDRGVLPDSVYDRIKNFIIAHRERK